MKIIMRRDSIIFYFENNRIDNAIRRCLSNWNLRFQFEMSMKPDNRNCKKIRSRGSGFLQRVKKPLPPLFTGEVARWLR